MNDTNLYRERPDILDKIQHASELALDIHKDLRCLLLEETGHEANLDFKVIFEMIDYIQIIMRDVSDDIYWAGKERDE